jgi:hypothetical protein
LLVVPGAYLDPHSPLYVTQEEWAAMWRKALGADGKRIIDIRVTENPGEVAKYVTKPGAYLSLDADEWRCDSQTLEALHYGLAGRRMVTWSRSLSPIRKALKFLDDDGEVNEDLIDVGDDDDGEVWLVTRILTYRWTRQAGRWAYRLTGVCKPDAGEDEGTGFTYYAGAGDG